MCHLRPVTVPSPRASFAGFSAAGVTPFVSHALDTRRDVRRHAYEESGEYPTQDSRVEEYYEVRVDSVRCAQGASLVNLRVVGLGSIIPVHVGEPESNALLKEINRQRQMRPNTHDVMKNILNAIGYAVVKIRITDIITNTFFARIHIARINQGVMESEVDVDARPSDAINMAVRFGAPMYVSKHVALSVGLAEPASIAPQPETSEDVIASVRDTLSSYDDPTIMFQLQKDLAIMEENYPEAQRMQATIFHEMTHNKELRVVVAMESALDDGRIEEAAKLRDEFRKLMEGAEESSLY
jgi:bifunctional DNase/RNase